MGVEPESVTVGKRRFTCLSPHLVRMEFSPTGIFEDRRSLVAYAEKSPIRFQQVENKEDKLLLETGQLTIISRQNGREFFPSNLRIDYKKDGLTHTWLSGDRYYRNLGGTTRSLDYYNRDSLLQDVHPAATEPPDSLLPTENELAEVHKIYLQISHGS